MQMVTLFCHASVKHSQNHSKQPPLLSKAQMGGMPMAVEVAQRLKLLAANPDDMGSIPGTHTAEGESRLLKIVT